MTLPVTASSSAKALSFCVNDDHIQYFTNGNEMTEEALRAHVDRYADAGVGTAVFCTRGHRASYRSKVVDALWDPLPDGSMPSGELAKNTRKLFEAGIDPYVVWLDQCRRRAVQGWISIRMNDCHQSNPIAFPWADRRWLSQADWRNFPEAVPENLWQNNQYYDRENCCYLQYQPALCWNFAHPEVWSLMLALLNENADRYEPDAFELDFTRFPFCLRPGRYTKDAHVITELIQAFKRHLEKVDARRNRHTKIAVRVPWTPESAIGWGFQVDEWARLGLVDIVIPAPFRRSFQYDCRLDEWHAILPDNVELIPAIDTWVPSSEFTVNSWLTPQFLRGWCDVVAAIGVNRVYLFNFPIWVYGEWGNAPVKGFPELFRKGLALETFRKGDRRYQIGYVDFPPPGMPPVSELPRMLMPGKPVDVKMPVGELPAKCRVTVTPVLEPEPDIVAVDVQLNGSHDITLGSLCAGVNTITLTAWHKCRLTNVYLDITEIA